MFPINLLDAKVADRLQQTFLFSFKQAFLTKGYVPEQDRLAYSTETGCIIQQRLPVCPRGIIPALGLAT